MWVAVKLCVEGEFVLVQDLVGMIGVDQDIYVEVDEGEDAGFEAGGGVDVAVEAEQESGGCLETEDAVPAVGPEEFGAVCPGLDDAYERVSNLLGEDGFDDDERSLLTQNARAPAALDAAVMFAGVDENFLQNLKNHPFA